MNVDIDRQVNEIELPHPRSVAKVVSRIFLAAVIILAGFAAWRITSTAINRGTETMTSAIDPLAVPRMRAEVAAVDSEITAAEYALSKFESQTKTRWISREDDRQEFNRLNQSLLDLRTKRAHLSVDLTHALNRIELSRRLAVGPEPSMFDENGNLTEDGERKLIDSVLGGGTPSHPKKPNAGHWRIMCGSGLDSEEKK